MLKIIGFLALCGFGLWLGLAVVLTCFNHLGKYNIGGVPNTWQHKLFCLFIVVLLACYWAWLFSIAPFTVDLR